MLGELSIYGVRINLGQSDVTAKVRLKYVADVLKHEYIFGTKVIDVTSDTERYGIYGDEIDTSIKLRFGNAIPIEMYCTNGRLTTIKLRVAAYNYMVTDRICMSHILSPSGAVSNQFIPVVSTGMGLTKIDEALKVAGIYFECRDANFGKPDRVYLEIRSDGSGVARDIILKSVYDRSLVNKHEERIIANLQKKNTGNIEIVKPLESVKYELGVRTRYSGSKVVKASVPNWFTGAEKAKAICTVAGMELDEAGKFVVHTPQNAYDMVDALIYRGNKYWLFKTGICPYPYIYGEEAAEKAVSSILN